ncbi:hypothetical protein HYS91_03950 [Candidatus Daviesbacteria bacterium]|nr:hypothetical protein [Candidatus Daviesbacteria bacterium]
MNRDDENALQRRPGFTPGPLVVAAQSPIRTSLKLVAGAAIERITRERLETPPETLMPEHPIYILDPDTRRLICISKREDRGEGKTPDKYGLFASIVELDEEGKPKFTLSTSEVRFSRMGTYTPVVVGPNEFNMPPSVVEVVEEAEETQEGEQEEIAPWNIYLGQLQLWLNEAPIDPSETVESFVKRTSQKAKAKKKEVADKVRNAFPEGQQGFDVERTARLNVIITTPDRFEIPAQASRFAGFFPVGVHPTSIADIFEKMQVPSDSDVLKIVPSTNWYRLYHYIPEIIGLSPSENYSPAIVTVDDDAISVLVHSLDDPYSTRKYHNIAQLSSGWQKEYPIFALINIITTKLPDDPVEREGIERLLGKTAVVRKFDSGWYSTPYDQELYRGLLNKLMADLRLTMFVRGGAPLAR